MVETQNQRERRFNNNASQAMFIGNRSMDSVLDSDRMELAEIGGSFEAIAGRMQELVEWARAKGYVLGHEEQSAYMEPVYQKWKGKIDAAEGDPTVKEKVWKEYGIEWGARMAEHPKTWYDPKVAVVQMLNTRGIQQCPFEDCNTNCWNEDVNIVSRKTG